jgi:hypothetical protein
MGDGGPAVLATGDQFAQTVVVDDKNVYWIKAESVGSGFTAPPPDGEVLQCAKCGCGQPTILASGQPVPFGGGLAIDAAGVYWTMGDVMKVPIGGGRLTNLAVAQNAYGALAVDATSVYWADDRGLMKSSTAGGEQTTLSSQAVVGIALDSTNVYYTTTDAVFAVSKNGGPPRLLARGNGPGNIAVDGVNVYWTNFADGSSKATVMKVPIAGGAPTSLAAGLQSPSGIALDATSVYWTSNSAVMRVPTAGGTPEMLSPSNPLAEPWGVAVDATSVYWTELFSGANTNSGPAVLKLTPK